MKSAGSLARPLRDLRVVHTCGSAAAHAEHHFTATGSRGTLLRMVAF
jgi:hypothetical protein